VFLHEHFNAACSIVYENDCALQERAAEVCDARWLKKMISLASSGKPCFQLSSARSVGQPMFSGRKVCHNSGRCGSAKTVAIEER